MSSVKRYSRSVPMRYHTYKKAPVKTSYRGFGAYRRRTTPYVRRPYVRSTARASYRRPYVRGNGSYAAIGNAIAQLFKSQVARAGLFGAGLGAAGTSLALRGNGTYKIAKNSLMLGQDPPQIKNIMRGEAVVVQHREYITDVLSASGNGSYGSAFNLQSYDLNPGQALTFPWLSQVAANFQEYEFTGLVFEFKSLSADAVVGSNNSGALGSIVMATNYNAAANNFANKQDMLESEYSSDSKPSCDIIHPIECKRSLTPVSRLYIRTGTVPTGQDQRLFDLGNFQLATQGMQATSALQGELWCSYEVKFFKPILGGILSGLDINTDKFHLNSPGTANPLGTTQTVVVGSMGGTITASGTTYTFPAFVTQGTWLFTIVWTGTSATPTYPVLTLSSGLSRPTWYAGDTNGTATGPQASLAGTTQMVMQFIVLFGTNVASPAQVSFGSSGVYPGTATGDFIVTQINSNIAG